MLFSLRRPVWVGLLTAGVLTLSTNAALAQANCSLETNETARSRAITCPERALKVSCGEYVFELDGDACCLIDRENPVTAYCGSSGEQVSMRCRGATHSVMIEKTDRGLEYHCLSAFEDPEDPDEETAADPEEFEAEDGATGSNTE